LGKLGDSVIVLRLGNFASCCGVLCPGEQCHQAAGIPDVPSNIRGSRRGNDVPPHHGDGGIPDLIFPGPADYRDELGIRPDYRDELGIRPLSMAGTLPWKLTRHPRNKTRDVLEDTRDLSAFARVFPTSRVLSARRRVMLGTSRVMSPRRRADLKTSRVLFKRSRVMSGRSLEFCRTNWKQSLKKPGSADV
jgi:hypothetical protein